MQFEGVRRTSHVPNLTPLIDIVFLLLVFFMLTSQFVSEEVIDIQLPEAETGETKAPTKMLEVVIKSNGVFLFKDLEVVSSDLLVVLKHELMKQKDKVVRIKGDGNANLASTVELIDLARKAGAQGVDIITVKNVHN